MRLKRILLKSSGITLFLAGAVVWAVAFSALLLNAADLVYFTQFSWSLLARAVAGLLAAVAGVIMFRAGSTAEESTLFRI